MYALCSKDEEDSIESRINQWANILLCPTDIQKIGPRMRNIAVANLLQYSLDQSKDLCEWYTGYLYDNGSLGIVNDMMSNNSHPVWKFIIGYGKYSVLLDGQEMRLNLLELLSNLPYITGCVQDDGTTILPEDYILELVKLFVGAAQIDLTRDSIVKFLCC